MRNADTRTTWVATAAWLVVTTAAGPAVLALSGCFHPSYGDGLLCSTDGACPAGWSCSKAYVCTPDGSGDGGGDAPASLCFGTAPSRICLAQAPAIPLTLSDKINTFSSSMCTATTVGGGDDCVIAATTITIGGPLRGFSSRPLVLIASDTITVNAAIDVSSSGNYEDPGAGSSPSACALGTLPGTRGGGAGGSFAGAGGTGGAGGTVITDPGGGGGKPGTAVSETDRTIRGGCPGQPGNGNSSAGGRGGGAVYLIARKRIDIGPGVNILAVGEGGTFGASKIGGNGAGSGGMIGFDAPTVSCNGCGMILASGGGGGEGGGTTNQGLPGQDPVDTAPAGGGSGSADAGGDGGDGSAKASRSAGAPGQPGTLDMAGHPGAGGGGGGGAGLILAPANANLGTQVSPLPVSL